jgi:choline-sulfatase
MIGGARLATSILWDEYRFGIWTRSPPSLGGTFFGLRCVYFRFALILCHVLTKQEKSAVPMRVLYLDIDTLRPDHLGCYGYSRPTSPNIDEIARRGFRFDQMYVSDSPCLPSRTALSTGQFGLRTGVVNHGGRRSELFDAGAGRGRQREEALQTWPALLRAAGYHTTTISTFAERHSAFHWYAGYNEVLNLGTDGRETADEVHRLADDWLCRYGSRDGWFLHVHFWDPHTPYRTPEDYGHPFADLPVPSWVDDEVVALHRLLTGPHSAQEPTGWGRGTSYFDNFPRQPQNIASTIDVRAVFDGYDTGIHYADEYVGRIIERLGDLGVYDETAVLVSSDHGENLGELGIYCDHQTADLSTHRVPAVLSWPGMPPGVDAQLRYQFDLAATVADLAGATIPAEWDGESFAARLTRTERGDNQANEREFLVLSCGTWTVQRSIRFGQWLCIWTWHDGYHGYPEIMLFDVDADPHERLNCAETEAAVVGQAAEMLARWTAETMGRAGRGEDPLWTVVAEGGGLYVRGALDGYLHRLEESGRADQAAALVARRRPVGRLHRP